MKSEPFLTYEKIAIIMLVFYSAWFCPLLFASAYVSIDNTTNGTITSPGNVVATGSGGEVLMLVVKSNGSHISAATWGGEALTQLLSQTNCANAYCFDVWYLLAPPAGTHAAVITGGSGSDVTTEILYTGAAIATPNFTNASNDTGTSNTVSITIGNAGSYVLTPFGGDGCGGTPSPWTELYNDACGQYRVSSQSVNAGSYSNSISGYAHAVSAQVEICPVGTCGDIGEGGGGGGDATTTATTTTAGLINNPNQDFFNGVVLFLVSFFGTVWLFRRRT